MRHYPGENGHAPYGEGLMVGYRHYDASGTTPAFPFGYGLSYTTFEISAPILDTDTLTEGGDIEVSADLRNTGEREGAETVQFYLEWDQPGSHRPPRALVGFEKVHLKAGESTTVRFTLRYKDLLTYDPEQESWTAEGTVFRICAGPNSRNLKKCPFTVS